MSEFDPDRFEADLHALRAANPPRKALDRLLAELSARSPRQPLPLASRPPGWCWLDVLRWVAPAVVAMILATILLLAHSGALQKRPRAQSRAESAYPSLKADQLEIDRQLVANFDAVARLPSGEPMRFRCQQWIDKVSLRDSGAGLVIERTTPRLEIVPVKFETD